MGDSLGEFALIERFFRSLGPTRADVNVGVGDDGAVLTPPAGQQIVAVTDTLVEGRHFPVHSPAASIGHRALAVNLSDIAAMGAQPAWALLALTLPRADAAWLAEFARGFHQLAAAHGVALVGGDTTAGPLTITVTVLGCVPAGKALCRGGGRIGDQLFVSGTPGDAARGLHHELANAAGHESLRQRFLFPTPRVSLGFLLRDIASAAIDVSDGLAADAAKLAAASHCGAVIDVEQLPLSQALLADLGEQRAIELALTGGDDYELCFTVAAARLELLSQRVAALPHPLRRIGELRAAPGLELRRSGMCVPLPQAGFEHFS